MDSKDKPVLSVKIQTPRESVYDGKAIAVSSINSEGKFDILPQHANFITIVEDKPITLLREDKEKVTFNFKQAIILNIRNQVTVFADPSGVTAKPI